MRMGIVFRKVGVVRRDVEAVAVEVKLVVTMHEARMIEA